MNNNDFTKRGLENLEIMEQTGFLKQMGYSKGGWKLIVIILGFLGIASLFFLRYTIYDGKIQFNTNTNLLCEEQVCELTCPDIPPNNFNITCEPNINITINPNILI